MLLACYRWFDRKSVRPPFRRLAYAKTERRADAACKQRVWRSFCNFPLFWSRTDGRMAGLTLAAGETNRVGRLGPCHITRGRASM